MREKKSYEEYGNFIHEYIRGIIEKNIDEVGDVPENEPIEPIDDVSPTEEDEKENKETIIKPFKFE